MAIMLTALHLLFVCMTLYSLGSKANNDVFKMMEVKTTVLIVSIPLHLNLFCC